MLIDSSHGPGGVTPSVCGRKPPHRGNVFVQPSGCKCSTGRAVAPVSAPETASVNPTVTLALFSKLSREVTAGHFHKTCAGNGFYFLRREARKSSAAAAVPHYYFFYLLHVKYFEHNMCTFYIPYVDSFATVTDMGCLKPCDACFDTGIVKYPSLSVMVPLGGSLPTPRLLRTGPLLPPSSTPMTRPLSVVPRP